MTIRNLRRGIGLTVFVAVLGAAAWVLANPYAVPDWFRLRGYVPPATISALAEETTMNQDARHLFYINRPQLEDKATFTEACPQADEHTIVIGCYLGGQRGIHILSVNDERLAGIEQVTAAHEMLHAAYDRLSKADKDHIDNLLQEYADRQLQDERLKAILKTYETTEPGQQHNEMHSIFGTEIIQLPAELETYYAKYFDDRGKVAAYAAQYQEAFTSRQAAVKDYDSQLSELGDSIKSDTTKLEQQADEITSMRQQLDSYRAAGDIARYNASVDPFNQKIDAYNTSLNATRSRIDRYNQLVEERNAVADQTAELQQAISGNSLPDSQ